MTKVLFEGSSMLSQFQLPPRSHDPISSRHPILNTKEIITSFQDLNHRRTEASPRVSSETTLPPSDPENWAELKIVDQ